MAALIAAAPLYPASAHAQQAYGPADEAEVDEDAPLPADATEPCNTEVQEEGVILVCRELTDSERYMSPLPRPTRSDRVIIPGLTDPPCWVTNPASVGTASCIRFGYAPEPALMIDVTAFPEPLSAEDAALVSEVEPEPDAAGVRGRRIPIDLSEGG
ncbi:hypothetical protein AAV99_04775 [Aurantiacibacter marinus]|uniref:Uncharacterized protein n=1 Tax=Aurantiacibacter marinus TaxID=874156 RepID=A0A0H0XS81_9SPHN|nr:hypothetical protein AAV99_04775 [Aurantiacibacter marinus]